MARKNRLLIAGSPEAEIVKDLTPAPQDLLVARSSGLIGFHGTALDAMLRRMRIETIVIAGVSTNVAVAGCAMAGADLGYHVIIAEDCVAAADPVTHEVIIKDQLRMIAHVASADDVEQALQGSGPY
jgi:nicotinamidase-related amidase